VLAHGCRKRKMLICGTEEKIEVAHGRLPSPARHTGNYQTFCDISAISFSIKNDKFFA